MSIRITGTGSYLPDQVLSNDDIAKSGVATSDAWVQKNLGITTRRIAASNQVTSDLAYNAAIKAIESAKIKVSDIDAIIVATSSPDRLSPSTACILQDKLGAYGCCAFDINAVCTGFVYGLTVASSMLLGRQFKKILLVGAETYSRITDWNDRQCVYFGDGAGAVIVESDPTGFFDFDLGADGSGKEFFTVKGGGSEYPASHRSVETGHHYFDMIGRKIFEFATKALPKSIKTVLDRNDIATSEVEIVLPHQPNINILKKVAEETNIPVEKVQICLDTIGNTAGASVPIALDWAIRDRKIATGDLVLMTAVGSGMTWGTAIMRW
jgi:3-oxoacyl-[acyl-carrier-protein] synthase III